MHNDLKRHITSAIIKGINESFDIGDMDVNIDDAISSKQKIRKHSKICTEFMQSLKTKNIEISLIDYNGNIFPIDEWDEDVSKVAFVKFTIDGHRNHLKNGSVIIKKVWKLDKMTWDEADEYMDNLEIVCGNVELKGRLPKMEEMEFLYSNRDTIDTMLQFLDTDVMNCVNHKWWTASTFFDKQAVAFIYSYCDTRTKGLYIDVMPVYDIIGKTTNEI